MNFDALPATSPSTVDEYHDQLETHWSHNRISRRTALRGALLGAGAIALANFPSLKRAFAAGGGTSGPSGAVIVGRRVSFSSSGKLDPTNSMRLPAQGLFPGGANGSSITGLIRFGATNAYGATVAADIVNLTGVVPNSHGDTLAGNQF